MTIDREYRGLANREFEQGCNNSVTESKMEDVQTVTTQVDVKMDINFFRPFSMADGSVLLIDTSGTLWMILPEGTKAVSVTFEKEKEVKYLNDL